jgi:hypothetical protein
VSPSDSILAEPDEQADSCGEQRAEGIPEDDGGDVLAAPPTTGLHAPLGAGVQWQPFPDRSARRSNVAEGFSC